MQIKQHNELLHVWGMSMNAYKEMPARSYLHTDYSDTDADLCIKIMSLCFTLISHASTIEDSLYSIFGY